MSVKTVYRLGERGCTDASTENLQRKIRGLILALQMYENAKNWAGYADALRELGELYQRTGDLDKMIDMSEKELMICNHFPGKTGLRIKARYAGVLAFHGLRLLGLTDVGTQGTLPFIIKLQGVRLFINKSGTVLSLITA